MEAQFLHELSQSIHFFGFPPLLRQRVKGILRQGRFTLIYKDGPRPSPQKKEVEKPEALWYNGRRQLLPESNKERNDNI
jgi:hypothetical protein